MTYFFTLIPFNSRFIAAFVLFLALLPFAPAHAVDGVREINAASAAAGGVTAGDAPGFPVSITEPGSYRLTGTLATVTASHTLIDITTSDVTLDLNGFGLKGPAVCTGIPVDNCTPSATGTGVQGHDNKNIVVLNGWVQGVANGIALSLDDTSHTRVELVHAFSNASDGIIARAVTDCEVIQNQGHGIQARVARNNTVRGNAGHGIRIDGQGLVQGNEVELSGVDGINTSAGTIISGNNSSGNADDGIQTEVSLVTGNTATRNDGFGLNMSSGSYSNNFLFWNNPNGNCMNPQVSGGVNAGSNTCCTAACP